MKIRNIYFTIVGVLVCGALLIGCGDKSESNMSGNEMQIENTTETSQEQENGQSQEEQQEPYILTFEAVTTEGEEITSDIFAQSKLTMINVWATYCNPCLKEMPALGEISENYDTSEFRMIGIVSDVTEEAIDDVATAKSLIEETQANYPHLLLNESLYVNLVGAVEAVPTTFFINRQGEMLGYLVGSYDKQAWEEIIAELLSECE